LTPAGIFCTVELRGVTVVAKKKLGEVLRERGHISGEQLHNAIQEQQGKLLYLGELLLDRGLVAKEDLLSALVEVTQIPYVDCRLEQPAAAALKLIPQNIARRTCVLPLSRKENVLIVAMAEPQNLNKISELRFLTGLNIAPRFGIRDEILEAIDRCYADPGSPQERELLQLSLPDDSILEDMEFITTSARKSNQEATLEFQADLKNRRTPAVRLVSSILRHAADKRASDVHIEPQSLDTVVRFRVDGVLREFQRIPRGLQNSLASRIKILADLDIAERRVPQDGRFLVRMGKKKFDLRVSSLPTAYGEKVVLRLLSPESPLASFDDLGLSRSVQETLNRVLALPQGVLLVTGPTGSGKSTTLYASLNKLRSPGVNIVTVEDPVEYMLEGLNQVQVNMKAGLTFASALRSILRQDPDIILLGEVRDLETAEIAMKAAQTGHLVLSTLHTNDSISALTRLLDLEVPGYMIASSVSAIMAQRLVRRLCSCHKRVPPSPEQNAQHRAVGLVDPAELLSVPVGCPACDQTGYLGRVGIYEILWLDDAMRASIRSEVNVDEIRALARNSGMVSLQADALDKIQADLTTLEEVQRVIYFDDMLSLRCPSCDRDLHQAFAFCPGCGAKTAGVSVHGHAQESESVFAEGRRR